MLHYFKKKKKSSPFFPENYIDIHSHIIPGIDDGAKSVEESIALLQKMNELGIQNFVCTPHVMESVWENSSQKITSQFSELEQHLKNSNLKHLSVRFAAEYMLDQNFQQLLENKDILPIKDNYILVEMSYLNPPINLYEMLFDIQIAGYQPILAHPERYKFLHSTFNEYQKLKDAGCLFQLNLLSLSSYYGKDVNKIAIELLKKNMIDVASSDAHHQKHLATLEEITKNSKLHKLVQHVLENNKLFI